MLGGWPGGLLNGGQADPGQAVDCYSGHGTVFG